MTLADDNVRMARYLLATAADETARALLAELESFQNLYEFHMARCQVALDEADRLLGFRQVAT